MLIQLDSIYDRRIIHLIHSSLITLHLIGFFKQPAFWMEYADSSGIPVFAHRLNEFTLQFQQLFQNTIPHRRGAIIVQISIHQRLIIYEPMFHQIPQTVIMVKMGMCQHKSRYSQTTQVNIQ